MTPPNMLLGYRAEIVLYDDQGRRLHIDNAIAFDHGRQDPILVPEILMRAVHEAREAGKFDLPVLRRWRVERGSQEGSQQSE